MHDCHGCWTLQVSLVSHLIFRLFVLQTNSKSALIKEFNGETDDFIICDYSLVLICHFSSILIGSIRSIYWVLCIEVSPSLHFIFEEAGDQLVHDVL